MTAMDVAQDGNRN